LSLPLLLADEDQQHNSGYIIKITRSQENKKDISITYKPTIDEVRFLLAIRQEITKLHNKHIANTSDGIYRDYDISNDVFGKLVITKEDGSDVYTIAFNSVGAPLTIMRQEVPNEASKASFQALIIRVVFDKL
jgi:hypothetical protein